jgi:hypothetical protein
MDIEHIKVCNHIHHKSHKVQYNSHMLGRINMDLREIGQGYAG